MSKGRKKPGNGGEAKEPLQTEGAYHVPIMLQEVLEGLDIKPGGVYVDCTFGGGGHSRAILEKLDNNGRLIAFDQDADARVNIPDDDRVIFVPHNFRHLQRFLRLHQFEKVDGIMADLGVSSHQFNEAERGFSIRYDADMDMRMDTRQSLTAYEVINTYDEHRLHKLFEQYGEVTNAKTLAKLIVDIRKSVSLKTIHNFKTAIQSLVKGNPNKYFAQVFQALRIEVNNEMGVLKELLEQIPGVLKTHGRAAIITFHSLEDRQVKNFFKRGVFEEEVDENPFEIKAPEILLKPVTKKPLLPSVEEIKHNSRARSAKLRVAEKV